MSASHSPNVFGHKAGLFLLFFTEMWERFSYYGMRALLVLFLVSEMSNGGWGWSREDALKLYAWYTGLVYITPILGGMAADRILGHRGAVLLGALLMTLGHASMAMETRTFFYIGLALLIVGNGFFKPNISTMVGQLYTGEAEKKDAAYTIFYMGINAGAFLGILLCGYIGEKVGWSWGFGLAGIFMFLGMLMFQFGGQLLPSPAAAADSESPSGDTKQESDSSVDSKTIERDRLLVIAILSCSTIFFWMAFEQAGGSMTIFARDYTGRILSGGWATAFFWSNTLLTVVPLAVVTYVLYDLVRKTFGQIPLSNAFIGLSFVLIWGIAIWMLNKEFNMTAYELSIEGSDGPFVATLRADSDFSEGQSIRVLDIEGQGGHGKLKVLEDDAGTFEGEVVATVVREKDTETEVPASWFGILNSFYIIAFAPLLTKIWESKWNPSAPVKFGIGLILLGLGFGALVIGSGGIAKGAATASVSIWWLIGAYWFHTMGELCVSPVGLSYVSKLAPARLVGLMFGVWFGATAIANYAAGWTGSFIDAISDKYGLTTFFLIYTVVPIAAGIAMWLLNGWLKKKMHGIT